MNKYLLEIGTEELPAQEIDHALEQLRDNMEKLLKEERIQFEKIETYGSPRRLVLTIEGLADRQDDLQSKVRGPNKRIAYDEDGNPSKALQGFMRGQKIDLSQVILEEYNGEDYIYANILKEGQETSLVLAENMAGIIKSINFPKSMKWGGKNLRFARPIRWIVSMMNEEVIDFSLEGIKVGRVTRGHRFLGEDRIELNTVEEYFEKLEDNYCLVDFKERKDIIKVQAEKLAKEKGGNLLIREGLLDEVAYLVEYPTAAIGRIKEDYLSLPREVIITPMQEQLRFFPLVDDKNRLLPYFITIRNGNKEHLDLVVKGNEKVLGARLEDAKFFYEEDIKQPLEAYVDRLKTVVFQDKLGTMYDKTIRVQSLARRIGDYLAVGEETQANLHRAAYLAKADLVTNMVGEFAELQGKMGMEYAKNSEENEIVSLAVYEQYLPRFSGDDLPTTTAGAILSIADKLDNIAGSFAIGLQPTGSQDPYGLRRQALGIINIILDRRLSLSLEKIIDFILFIYVEENNLIFNYDDIKDKVFTFFNGRIKNMLMDMEIRYDIVDGVISTGIDDIYDLTLRAEKINAYLEEEGFEDVISTFNRVVTLAKKSVQEDIREDLFVEEAEVELYKAFNSIREDVKYYLREKEYEKALDVFMALREPVDKFFDKVMVMVEDEEVRENRLGLLGIISKTMLSICDLSKLVK